ncbi:unnamed protein product, partial [Mesorhabditis belari]|uniref:Uncharacterized protein n=1 Tax=Mesorhabditis belari TaxID=2138241 RepID=A0AAF3EU39_9BILA
MSKSNVTNSYDHLPDDISNVIQAMTVVVMILSLFTTPLAAYFSAKNDRLSWPIRLLACAENVNKFIQASCYILAELCILRLQYEWIPVRCTRRVTFSFNDIRWYIEQYGLSDIALYCQCLVSLRLTQNSILLRKISIVKARFQRSAMRLE